MSWCRSPYSNATRGSIEVVLTVIGPRDSLQSAKPDIEKEHHDPHRSL